MKKVIISLCCIILFGGIAYIFYGEKTKGKAKPNIVLDTIVETETIEKEDLGEVRTDIPVDKVWEYSFDQPLDAESISNETISVTNEDNESVDVEVEIVEEGKTLLVHPPPKAYEKGGKYNLSIKKDLAYRDGGTVDEDYLMSFVTERDEVAKGKLNPAIMKIEEEQVNRIDGNKVEIQKSEMTQPLESESLIIVPTEQHPEGQALKVITVEEKSNTYILEVVEPEFVEIYEELDINKSYSLESDNFTPAETVSGMEIRTISASRPFTLLAGATTKEVSGERAFIEKKQEAPAKTNDGIQIDFTNFVVDEKREIALDGSVHLFSPEVRLDMKHSFLEIDHMNLETKMTIVNDFTVKKAKTEVIDIENLNIEPESLKAYIGTIHIPTGVPGLFIQGNLILRLDLDINGAPEALLYLEYNEKTGVYYDGETVDNVSNTQMDTNFGVQGKGDIAGKAGPAVSLLVSGFGVAGIGAEGFAGLKLNGEAVAGADTKNGPFACGKVAFGGFSQLSIVVNVLKTTLLEYEIAEFPIGEQAALNNCERVIDFASVEAIVMNASEEREVAIENQVLDLLSKENSMQVTNMESVDIRVSASDVLDVKKVDGGIAIRSVEMPSVETAKIILDQNIDGKVRTLVIPVKIGNFNELKNKQAKKDQPKKEQPEKKQESNNNSNWQGEWERFDFQSGGLLTIKDINGQSFAMKMSVSYGGRSGELEGIAQVTGNKAVYVDKEFGTDCRLELLLKENSIVIEQNESCWNVGGLGTFFNGEFENTETAVAPPPPTLSSLNIVDEEQDAVIRQMLGNDYDYFVESMQVTYDVREEYGLSDTLAYAGGVPSLYTIMEGIILIDSVNNYYIANIDGNKVKFYTNDPAYRNELPAAINRWRERFSQYPIEYFYKELN